MLRLSLRSYIVDFTDVLEKDIHLLSVECKILYLLSMLIILLNLLYFTDILPA